MWVNFIWHSMGRNDDYHIQFTHFEIPLQHVDRCYFVHENASSTCFLQDWKPKMITYFHEYNDQSVFYQNMVTSEIGYKLSYNHFIRCRVILEMKFQESSLGALFDEITQTKLYTLIYTLWRGEQHGLEWQKKLITWVLYGW